MAKLQCCRGGSLYLLQTATASVLSRRHIHHTQAMLMIVVLAMLAMLAMLAVLAGSFLPILLVLHHLVVVMLLLRSSLDSSRARRSRV